jgi:hypothetical protein
MHIHDPLLSAVLLHDRRVRYEVEALRWSIRGVDGPRGRSRRAATRRTWAGDAP